MANSKNILNITVKKIGRPDKMIAISVLIIFMLLDCAFDVTLRQDLGQPILLEVIFGLTHISP
jgi:hypothetical protein